MQQALHVAFDHDPTCLAAAARSNATSWKALCSSSNPPNRIYDQMCAFGKQAVVTGSYGKQKVWYVHNQKAASSMISEKFGALFNVSVTPNPGHQSDTATTGLRSVITHDRNSRIFTFVRHPADVVLGGYLELRHRVHLSNLGLAASQFTHKRKQRNVLVSGPTSPHYVEPYKTMARNWVEVYNLTAGGVSACVDRRDATRQFIRFLEAVRDRRPLGFDAYHVFPQVQKIAHVVLPTALISLALGDSSSGAATTRYDGIGRTESLREDLRHMRAAIAGDVGPQGGGGMRQGFIGRMPASSSARTELKDRNWGLGAVNHSHVSASCHDVDMEDAAVRALLCDLYAADYACFRYEGCSTG